MHKIKNSNKGFTIIEVLIVLAIAGLILLIVFLAVPALQRNARNTSRKQDAAATLAAISEYSDNNGGTNPAGAVMTNPPTVKFCNPNTCAGTDAQSTAKMGYYTGASIAGPAVGKVNVYNPYTAPPAAANAADELIIEIGGNCTSATTIAQAGSTRSVAALYGLETASGYTWQCTGSST